MNIYERANRYRHKQTDTQGRILQGWNQEEIAIELKYHETRKGKYLMVRKGWIRWGKKRGCIVEGNQNKVLWNVF